MSTNTPNPIRKHTSTLFASRGCDFDQAMQDAAEIIEALPTENKASAYTALMMLVNTAANAFDQARGPSPEKLAVMDMIREVVVERVAQAQADLDERINDWMSDNLDERISGWMSDNLDDLINDWMNDNLESKMEGEALCEAIRDAFRNNLSISIN